MRLLYVGSRIDEQQDGTAQLLQAGEIHNIELCFSRAAWRRDKASFLPDLIVEDLAEALEKFQPDVLHISTHGDPWGLCFASRNREGGGSEMVIVDAKALAAFFSRRHPPRLVLLNACDSIGIARELAELGVAAIGTTAPITNEAATAIATQFYAKLLDGASLEQAFQVIAHLGRVVDGGKVEIELFAPSASMVLNPAPRLIARVEAVDELTGAITVRLGLVDVGREFMQICFFTDARSNKPSEPLATSDLQRDISDGAAWSDAMILHSDCWIAACGLLSSGETFALSQRLRTAILDHSHFRKGRAVYNRTRDRALGLLSTFEPSSGAGD